MCCSFFHQCCNRTGPLQCQFCFACIATPSISVAVTEICLWRTRQVCASSRRSFHHSDKLPALVIGSLSFTNSIPRNPCIRRNYHSILHAYKPTLEKIEQPALLQKRSKHTRTRDAFFSSTTPFDYCSKCTAHECRAVPRQLQKSMYINSKA